MFNDIVPHCDITYWFELVPSTHFEALSFGFRGVAMLVDFFFKPELCIFTSWSGGEERGAGFTEKPRIYGWGFTPLPAIGKNAHLIRFHIGPIFSPVSFVRVLYTENVS